MMAVTAAQRVRLGELIEDLLALNRGRGTQRTPLAPLDLAALAATSSHDLRVASSQRGVTSRLDVPRAAPVVLGRRSQLSRVVTNLVSPTR